METVFVSFAKRIKKINVLSIVQEILSDRNVQLTILDAIRWRLGEHGKDAHGNILITDLAQKQGFGYRYAYSTIYERKPPGRFIGKIQRGETWKHVTLRNEKNFYPSMDIDADKFYANIKAEFIKEDGHIYRNFTMSYSSQKEFEKEVLSPGTKVINSLIHNVIYPRLMAEIREAMGIKQVKTSRNYQDFLNIEP